MDISFDLLMNAIVAGLLLGGFYAAVTAGVSISFGMLDIVNIAHPAFIILGSYIAYIINIELGIDPIVVSIVMLPAFYVLGTFIYQVYYLSFEKPGQESLRGLAKCVKAFSASSEPIDKKGLIKPTDDRDRGLNSRRGSRCKARPRGSSGKSPAPDGQGGACRNRTRRFGT